MTRHLMNSTLQPDQARLAAYYARGMVREPDAPPTRREQENEAHVAAWLAGEVAPDLVRLAEHAAAPGTSMTEMEIKGRLVRDIERALAVADGADPLPPEVRALHGLPEPEPVPAYLQGLSAEALQARRDQMVEYWSAAATAADYQAEAVVDPNAPLAIVRHDLHPAAAIGLGISPSRRLADGEVDALLAGRRADGEKIAGKKYAIERRLPVDPKTGEQRYSTPIGSYDFCPTPDKSVSIAWAFAPPVEQAKILNAHLEAAREAVGYIATEIGKARLGDGGRDGAEAGHVAWLEFTHHTARRTQFGIDDRGEVTLLQDASAPGDPDLHTHFLIPNAVFCESGRVGSLDTAAIGGFIFEADAYYQARLAQNLRETGFAVELDNQTGAARMPVIPDEVRTAFSKRTAAGELLARKATEDRGEVWEELSLAQRDRRMKEATQDRDQKVKGGKDDIADTVDWQRQAKAIDWEVPKSFELYGPPAPELGKEQRIRRAYEVALPHLANRLEHQSVVPHWDVRVAAARGLVDAGISDLGDIGAVTQIMRAEGVTQYGERTALVWGLEEGKRYTSVTTALHETQEQEFIRLAQTAAADRSAALPTDILREKIEQSGLDFSGAHGQAQRAAIERLGHGGRFGVAVGSAGSGKTAMLQPLIAAWREQGREVYGASLAWRQADDLVEAGIDRRNLKAFSVLVDTIRDGSLTLGPQSVVAVDEWGLLGTAQALELLRLQERHSFSVVALGDDKQCASIQAGAIIDLSRRALGAEQVPEILTTVRQQTEREREIVSLFREGRAAEALVMKRADGTAEMAYGGYAEVVTRVAKLYRERLEATGAAPTISAPTNTDAHRIGEAVRAERRAMGLLGPDAVTVRATDGERDYALTLAKGDRVRLFRSTGADFGNGRGGNIGRNGSVLEVVGVDDQGLTLRGRSGKVGTVRWSDMPARRGRVQLAYGDVMTIHTAQGSTAKEHIFALPAGSQAVDGRLGYTANTRHRHAAYLVTSEAAERGEVRRRRPLNSAREITQDDKWANVARTLSWRPEKDTAIALLDRVAGLRRGSVRAFHDIAQTTTRERGIGHEVRIAVERVLEYARELSARLVHRHEHEIDGLRHEQSRGLGLSR